MLLVTGLFQVGRVLPALGISPEIMPTAVGYVHAMAWGMPALLGFLSLRYTSEGLGRTKPIMYLRLPRPDGQRVRQLGLHVRQVRHAAARRDRLRCRHGDLRVADVPLDVTYMRRQRAYRPFDFFARIDWPDRRVLRDLARIGMPIAGSVLAEGGLFVCAALMIGGMGATLTAGHQIALNYSSFMFMVPLAISSATTIHVGHTLGRGDRERGRLAGLLGIAMCASVMALSAIGIVLFNDGIASLYTGDPAVREVAAGLLLMAAIFQLSDGVQVGAAGALRGFKDTAIPMTMCIFSYWVVGFPLAYVFGVQRGGGPLYVWIGFIAGLTVSAVCSSAVICWCRGDRYRRRQWVSAAVIAVAERLDVFDEAVDEADLPHQLVRAEIVGPDFHRHFDVAVAIEQDPTAEVEVRAAQDLRV